MYRLFVIVCLAISGTGYAQCKHSIRLEKVEKNIDQTGSIDISVTTTDAFICTLYIQSGSGDKKAFEKKGSASATIHFDRLDTSVIYLVQFEFLSEQDKHCRKLQKSGIIIEAE